MAKSRPQLWASFVSDAKQAIEEIRGALDTHKDSIESQEGAEQQAATKEMLDAALAEHLGKLEAGINGLKDLRDQYQEWYDTFPENAQDSATHEKLEATVELDFDDPLSEVEELVAEDLDELAAHLDELENFLDECASMDLPKGFGRD